MDSVDFLRTFCIPSGLLWNFSGLLVNLADLKDLVDFVDLQDLVDL
jgi:hypothetical protein